MTAGTALEEESRPGPRFLFAVLLMGATALLAQVILARELLAVFFGNELSIALVLAVWLLAVSAGSAVGARLAAGLRAAERSLGWSQVFMAALLPLSLLAARRIQPASITPGQVLGPGDMLLTSLGTLSLAAALAGFQFVVAAKAAAGGDNHMEGRFVSPVALVYALEALGSVIAGLAFHCYLAEHLLPFPTAASVGLLNLLSATLLLRPSITPAGAARLLAVAVPAGFLVSLLAASGRVEMATLRASPRWDGLNAVDFVPSRYGALVVTDRAQQVSFYQSGVLLFTSQDDYANEATAHLPLLEHPDPRRVLVIGGAVAGLAAEVLRHPVDQLDCLELDPRVIDLARQWLPHPLLRPIRDRRVRLHVGDGRLFVRNARSEFDVIILNLPDPTTASANRFYTEDFLREAKRALAPGGILSFGLTGSEIHLSGSVLLAAATLDHTLANVFPDRLLVPGDRMLFLASERTGKLTSDWYLLSERLASRRIATSFVNDVWLRDALFPFRGDLMRETIQQATSLRANTDLNPVSYYHQTRVWLDQLSSRLSRPARMLSRISLWWALVPLAGAALVVALARGRRKEEAAVIIATAAVGAFGLVIELLALLAFQSACGYLYHALGLLIAAFMAGLALGAALVGRRTADPARLGLLLLAGVGTAALVAMLVPNLLRGILAAPSLAPIALGLLLLLAGSLVGGLFPIAVALYRHRQQAASAAGVIYAADVLGSAGAALIVGTVAVPLLGIAGTSSATALVLAAVVFLALPLCRRTTPG